MSPLLLLLAVTGCGGGSTGDASAPPSTGGSRLLYAVLGDSYSNGQSVGAAHAWPAVMAGLLTRDGLATQVVANPSVTGATTARMMSIGLEPIRASRPDVITVMLGVNDQVQGHTAAEFAADEDRALAAAIEITGSPQRVIVVDIPDYSVAPAAARFGDPASIVRDIDAFNEVIHKVAARRQVRLVSIVGISRRSGAGGIASDGLHPSSAQLAAWAARIEPVARRNWSSAATDGR